MFFKYNLIAILWALLILILTTLPGEDFPDLNFWSLLTFDKAAHMFVFAVLVLLLIIGFIKQYRFRQLRYIAVRTAFIIAVVYGALTELLQEFIFTDRNADLYDFIANVIGAVLGVIAFRLIYGKKKYYVENR
jgi:VanZ family protein